MGRVINLADHRDKRIRSAMANLKPPDRDSILIELDIDGTHSVTISGAYGTTKGLATEAVAEALAHLLRAGRRAGGP